MFISNAETHITFRWLSCCTALDRIRLHPHSTQLNPRRSFALRVPSDRAGHARTMDEPQPLETKGFPQESRNEGTERKS